MSAEVIKVVLIITKTAELTVSTVLQALRNAEIELRVALTQSLVLLDLLATVTLDFRAMETPGELIEVYPKLVATFPTEREGEELFKRLRAVREAMKSHLSNLATTEAWVIVGTHEKLYGGA